MHEVWYNTWQVVNGENMTCYLFGSEKSAVPFFFGGEGLKSEAYQFLGRGKLLSDEDRCPEFT